MHMCTHSTMSAATMLAHSAGHRWDQRVSFSKAFSIHVYRHRWGQCAVPTCQCNRHILEQQIVLSAPQQMSNKDEQTSRERNAPPAAQHLSLPPLEHHNRHAQPPRGHRSHDRPPLPPPLPPLLWAAQQSWPTTHLCITDVPASLGCLL